MKFRAASTALVTILVGLAPAVPARADRVRNDQWHLGFLRVAEAHAITRGEGVVVAVPDTGVHPHPDLQSNLLKGLGIVAGGTTDGRDDRDGHGTGMAGLIAAHGRGDGVGALGIAPDAEILPVQVRLTNEEGNVEDLADGINYAVRNGAEVVSISAGAAPNPRLQEAVSLALRANVIVVAGAGNRPQQDNVSYPASYQGVLAVGGIDPRGEHAAVSVTGPEIDVVAPAVDIYSTSLGGKYRKGTGTSDATAIVAGAAALVRAKYPYLPVEEVVHRLTATAVDKGPPGRDDEYGYGVIDLVAALTADVPPLGFESAASEASQPSRTPAAAGPADDDGTLTGWLTLGVLVAGGGAWAWYARRRRRGDDPPPRISR